MLKYRKRGKENWSPLLQVSRKKLRDEKAQKGGRGPTLASGLYFLSDAQPRTCTGRWWTMGPCQPWATPWALGHSSGALSISSAHVSESLGGSTSCFGSAYEKAVCLVKKSRGACLGWASGWYLLTVGLPYLTSFSFCAPNSSPIN